MITLPTRQRQTRSSPRHPAVRIRPRMAGVSAPCEVHTPRQVPTRLPYVVDGSTRADPSARVHAC